MVHDCVKLYVELASRARNLEFYLLFTATGYNLQWSDLPLLVAQQ